MKKDKPREKHDPNTLYEKIRQEHGSQCVACGTDKCKNKHCSGYRGVRK